MVYSMKLLKTCGLILVTSIIGLILHELGHVFILCLYQNYPVNFEFTIMGGQIFFRFIYSSSVPQIAWIGGPLVDLICIYVLFFIKIPSKKLWQGSFFLRVFFYLIPDLMGFLQGKGDYSVMLASFPIFFYIWCCCFGISLIWFIISLKEDSHE